MAYTPKVTEYNFFGLSYIKVGDSRLLLFLKNIVYYKTNKKIVILFNKRHPKVSNGSQH